MAGYCGYSMSNNACAAYESGERPRSKWSKCDIIKEAAEAYNLGPEDMKRLKSYSVKTLRDVMLICVGWHHTSKMYNRTDFYTIDDTREGIPWEELDRIQSASEEPEPVQKVKIRFTEWTGSRRHPRAEECEALAIVSGQWAYMADGHKKRIDGGYIDIVARYSRAPRGTAEEFRQIEERIMK